MYLDKTPSFPLERSYGEWFQRVLFYVKKMEIKTASKTIIYIF